MVVCDKGDSYQNHCVRLPGVLLVIIFLQNSKFHLPTFKRILFKKSEHNDKNWVRGWFHAPNSFFNRPKEETDNHDRCEKLMPDSHSDSAAQNWVWTVYWKKKIQPLLAWARHYNYYQLRLFYFLITYQWFFWNMVR